MSSTTDRPAHESRDGQGRAQRTGDGTGGRCDLVNTVEWDASSEGLCYVYPADASDSELKRRWLAAPACLLVDLEDTR